MTGLVLAGGKSSRFGTNKAYATYLNTPFVVRQIQLLAHYCDELYVSSGSRENTKKLREFIFSKLPSTIFDKLTFVTDRPDFNSFGPVKGIFSAISLMKSEFVLSVPVDMPLLNQTCIDSMIKYFSKSIDLISWIHKGRITYPFFLGKVNPIKKILEAMKNRKSVSFASVYRLIPSIMLIHPFPDDILANFNTPDGLEEYETNPPISPHFLAFRVVHNLF